MANIKNFFFKKQIVLISVLIGVVALWYIFTKIPIVHVFESLKKNVSWQLLLIYILIQIAIFTVLTYRWKIVLASQGITKVSLFKLNNYKLVGYAVSYITPLAKVGGEPVRAGLLSTREKVPFKKSLSSIVIDKTLELTTSAMFFVVGGIYILMRFAVASQLKFVIIVVSVFFVLLFGLFNYRMLRGKSFFHKTFEVLGIWKIKKMKKFSKKLFDFEQLVIKFYHEDRKYFFYTILISLISWILMFFEYMIVGKMVGAAFTPVQIFLVFSFVGVAYLVPIPMALGTLEAGQISVFGLINISAAAGVALSLIIRMKDIFISIIGLILLTIFGLKIKDVVKNAKGIDKEVERLKELEKKNNNRGKLKKNKK
jgi:uncharacterized protein (TIRG00374 family)